MKRIFLLALLSMGSIVSALDAQESVENELERVRKLRDKGWHDLAKQKIEELLKKGDPTLNAALPLELARLNIAAARLLDPDQRLSLFGEARKQLQAFVTQNKGKPEAALASAELARVTSYHAQAILSRAMREDENRVRHEKARPAETMFIQAGKDLEEAIKAIDAALPNAAGNMKVLLEKEKAQARFDIAVNLFDQAKTYIDRGKAKVNLDRSLTMSKAIDAFKVLRSDESSELGWLANAWLVKLHIEITDPDNALKYYKAVVDRQNDKTAQPAILPAIRLVRYFAMQDMTVPRPDEPETIGNHSLVGKTKIKMTALDKLRAVQKEGEAWLKAYPKYHKSYEGQGVRYELAHAYLAEASQEKDAKLNKALFAQASAHFKTLGDYDGELAERARQLNLSIRFKTVAEAKELKDFDDFYTKAMLERAAVIKLSQQLDKANPTEAKKIEEDRKKHLKDVVNALTKALSLSDATTSVQKIDDARYFLVGAYLAYGDPYRAAIVGEALGRSRSTRRSPEGASTALQTYSALMARHPEDSSIRNRLNDLAAFVLSPETQTSWKGEPVTSLAHYHLAMAANKEGDAVKAIKHLEKLTPEFVDYIYTQGQLVFIAQAAREKTEKKAEQKYFIDAAKAALARMPMYTKDDSSTVITIYYYAKLELSKFMYSEAIDDMNAREELKATKKLTDMAAYVRDLQNQFGTLPGKSISAENRDQIEFTMQIMLKYADLGIAEVKFRGDKADRFDQVIAATKGVVDTVLGKAKSTTGDIAMKDYRVTGDILSLALRANVQKGNIDQAKTILDVLNRLRGVDAGQKPGNVVAVLLNDIAAQIKAIEKEGNEAAFKKTREPYTQFLDVISKEYEAKGFDTNSAIMLAHAYNSLKYPCKAAPLFAKIKAPAGLDKEFKKVMNETDKQREERLAQEEEFGRYWAVQIEYIRSLRACKENESLKTAEATCNAVLKHPNAKYKFQAKMEKNYLLEDLQRYREAYLEWQAILKDPNLNKRLGDKEVQKIYFTAYYYAARTLYKTATLDAKIKEPKKLITAAASMMIKLEFAKTKEGWEIAGPLWEEFIKDKENKVLKDEYEKLKSLQKTSWLDRRPEVPGRQSPIARLAFARDELESEIFRPRTK